MINNEDRVRAIFNDRSCNDYVVMKVEFRDDKEIGRMKWIKVNYALELYLPRWVGEAPHNIVVQLADAIHYSILYETLPKEYLPNDFKEYYNKYIKKKD